MIRSNKLIIKKAYTKQLGSLHLLLHGSLTLCTQKLFLFMVLTPSGVQCVDRFSARSETQTHNLICSCAAVYHVAYEHRGYAAVFGRLSAECP